MKRALKFADPESIALRNKSRHEAMYRMCKTCEGRGIVYANYLCQEGKCKHREHEIEADCFCCNGKGCFEKNSS